MIWILMPAFNEGESLPTLIPKIDKALLARGESYRIVVVNDGSVDETSSTLDDMRENYPLEVITHIMNRGLGETERDGFEYIATECSPEDVIIRVESDDTHEPKYIFDLIHKLDEGYDVVNTSRFQPGGGQLGVGAYRAFISRAANLFMQTMFRIPGTRDYSCGFRAYRGRVIQDALRIFGNNFIQLRGLGFTSTLEMIVKLHIMGCKFTEVPFVLRYDKKKSPSKMIGSTTTLGYLIMAVLYYWPFGGWLSQFRGLSKIYIEDPEVAIDKFGRDNLSWQPKYESTP